MNSWVTDWIAPEVESSPMSLRSKPPSSRETALVRKILSFTKIGLDQPSPGISVLHAKPCSADQWVGSLEETTPSRFGPRKAGQSAMTQLPQKIVEAKQIVSASLVLYNKWMSPMRSLWLQGNWAKPERCSKSGARGRYGYQLAYKLFSNPWLQCLRYTNRAIGLLVVFHDRDHRSADGKCGAVESMAEFRALFTFHLIANT